MITFSACVRCPAHCALEVCTPDDSWMTARLRKREWGGAMHSDPCDAPHHHDIHAVAQPGNKGRICVRRKVHRHTVDDERAVLQMRLNCMSREECATATTGHSPVPGHTP